MNAVQLFLKRLGFSGGAQESAVARSKISVAPTPLLMALEPRVVYDASVAAAAQTHAAPAHAAGDAHAGAATANDATVPAAPKTIAEHDVGQGGARNGDGRHDGGGKDGKVGSGTATGAGSGSASAGDTSTSDSKAAGSSASTSLSDAKVSATGTNASTEVQKTLLVADAIATDTTAHAVVFIDSSVSNIQALIDGLPQGTEYVVLNASTDGFAQMADYLQAHPGVDAIHLISHGTDGMIQAGSTWLNASDLAAESAQLTRIGAAMNAGGDFLIYGCDVAQNADGQQLVQQIAALTHLNVAASSDATGAAALGGDWTLEYQAGTTHTAVIETAAGQARYGALLAQTVESYDTSLGFSTSASTFTLNGVTYTLDSSGAFNAVYTNGTPGSPEYGDPFPNPALSSGPTDGNLMLDISGTPVPLHSVTITMADGSAFKLSSFDLDAATAGTLYLVPDGDMSKAYEIFVSTDPNGQTYTGTVNVSGNANFANVHSVQILDVESGGGYMTPSLDNLTYEKVAAAVPIVTTDSGSAAWTSGDSGAGTSATPVAVDSGLTVSDPNSTTLTGATIRITGNYQSGDILYFTAQNGISASYSGGVLTLTGTATLADYQQALRSITFTNQSSVGSLSTATRTITYSITDSSTTSATATRTVTITKAEQSPVITTSSASTPTYQSGSGAVATDSGISVSDLDSTTLTAATVTLGSSYKSGDVLNFIAQNGISASYSGGVLNLFGSATVAQYQAALESITFSSTSTVAGTRDVAYSISDGTKTSAIVHRSVVVVPAGPTVTPDSGSAAFVTGDNTASTPVAVDPGITISDGSSGTLDHVTIQITGNLQANYDTLLFTNNPATMGDISAIFVSSTGLLTLKSASGTASLAQYQAAMRAVTFTSDFVVPSTATRTISFQIDDGISVSAVATRTLTVTDTDQRPLIGGGGNTSAFTAGDNVASTPVVVNGAVTVADADGGPLQTATVSISGNYHAGSDVLAFTNTSSTLYGDISASYTGGTLTLSSGTHTATLAQWQAALRAVTYTSLAVTPDIASRTITFSISDGTKSSTTISSTVTVTDTDQTPLISGSSGTVTLTQGDHSNSTPVTVDNGIIVSDLDNVTLASATVTIGNYDGSGDALLFVGNPSTMGDINGSYTNGVLTLTSLSSSATLAQWQAALRSIQYQNFSSVPDTTPRVISFAISDGTKTSSTWSRTVDVALTDQSPVLGTSGGTTAFVEGDNVSSTPVAVDSGLTLTDSDSATMESATVAITGNFQAGQDVLALGSGAFGDITASFDAGTGVLTLTSAGASTTAQWVAALRSVTYTNTAVTPNTATRTIAFSTSDGTKDSNTGTKSVSITGTDQSPVLTASSGDFDYLPGAAAQTIDSGITLGDLDSTTMATLTVQIGAGFQSGDQVSLLFNAATMTSNFNVTFDGAAGTLTITRTGTMTLANWQAVIDNLQFSSAPGVALGTRSLTIVTNDGVKDSNTLTYHVDVISSAPQLSSTSTGSAAFVAGDNSLGTPVVVDGGISVSDPLGNPIQSATISITGGLHSAEDVLSFSNDGATMGDISLGSYNALTGVMTLVSASGTATDTQWAAALNAVIFFDTAVTPNTATRTISFSVSDGTQDSTAVTRTVTVAAVDQTPILTASGGDASYVAGDNVTTTVVVDSGITVSDLDNTTLQSALVSITGGFRAGEDQLAFDSHGDTATYGNISASFDATTGELTLSSSGGSATLAQWQAALRAVTYADTAAIPDTATRVISFTVGDGVKSSDATVKQVDLTAVDQTPILVASADGTTFVSGDGVPSTPVVIDSGLTVADRDNTTLVSATVSITTGFHAGEDVLAFAGNDTLRFGNISGSYDASTGVMTLTSAGGTATLAQWQAALNSVTYVDTAVVPAGATRTIGFSVNDGTKDSAVAARQIDLIATTQTPSVVAGTGDTPTFTASGADATPVAIDSGITIVDGDAGAHLESAVVTISGNFQPDRDVLAFTASAATGNISASYDARTGVLTLSSAGNTATLAQWQAALAAVTYADTAVESAGGSRTVDFVLGIGGKTSAPLSRTISIAAGPIVVSPPPPPIQPTQPVDPVLPAIISLLPPPPVAPGGNVWGNGPSTPRGASAPDGIAFFPMNLLDGISNPLIVADALTDAPTIGAIPGVSTVTFTATEIGEVGDAGGIDAFGAANGQQAHGSLSRTAVDSATPIPAPDMRELSLSEAAQAVRVNAGPNQPFSVSLPLLVGSAGGPSAADAHVTVRMADGRPLPAWVRFDPVRGTLEGKTPANGGALQIQIVVRDATGNESRRAMTIQFAGPPRHAEGGAGLPGAGHPGAALAHEGAVDAIHAEAAFGRQYTDTALADAPAPASQAHAAAPAAKPSLSEQFARAHASLHIARPVAVAGAGAAAAHAPADRPHA